MKQQTTEKKNSQLVSLPFVAIVLATIVGYILIFATPVIGEFPVEIQKRSKYWQLPKKESCLRHPLV